MVYLDPDICVFSALSDVEDALDDHAILLTPHQSVPEASLAGVMANELTSLRYGTYNLGFLGCPPMKRVALSPSGGANAPTALIAMTCRMAIHRSALDGSGTDCSVALAFCVRRA